MNCFLCHGMRNADLRRTPWKEFLMMAYQAWGLTSNVMHVLGMGSLLNRLFCHFKVSLSLCKQFTHLYWINRILCVYVICSMRHPIWRQPLRRRESMRGMRRQRMGLSSDAHQGWLSWLHQLNNNLIPDQAWTNGQGQMEGYTAAWSSNIPLSFLTPNPLQPTQPHPSPHSIPPSPPRPLPLTPGVHTEHPPALAPPSDITLWLKLLVAPECGISLEATKTI